MSETQKHKMYDGWKEDVHEALVGGIEWLRQPEVMEQFLGLMPKLKALLHQPDFTSSHQGVASLLQTASERSPQATTEQLRASAGRSIERMAVAMNNTMGQKPITVNPIMGAYPLKYTQKDPSFADRVGFKPLSEFAGDLVDHLNPTYGYILMSKQFASFDFGLHPLDDSGWQVDFTYMFENLWGPHSVYAPGFGFYKPKHIRVIPGIQLSYRNGKGLGFGAKAEMFTWWWCERKEVTVAWAAFSATFQRKTPVAQADHLYEPVGQIRWGGGAVFKQRRFLYDFIAKAAMPISLEHKTMWLTSPAKDTFEIRFSEMLKNPINTGGMQLFMWDMFADMDADPEQAFREKNVTYVTNATTNALPEITIRGMFYLAPAPKGSPVW